MCQFAYGSTGPQARIPENYPLTAYKVVNVTRAGSWLSTGMRLPRGVRYQTGKVLQSDNVPTENNRFGFWLFRNKTQAKRQGIHAHCKRRIIEVLAWGRVVITPEGYRAEFVKTVTKKAKRK